MKILHGNAPDKSKIALLLIDVINDFDFEGGDKLLKNSLPMAKNIAKLKQKAKKADVPVIYVNDNFGKWQSNLKNLLAHCVDKKAKGAEIVKLLAPDEDDYFVLKPKHSGFFSSTLEVLLEYLECETLILTGITTDICILFTAHDAYMRDFDLIIPADCVAAVELTENEHTLKYMERVVKADTRSSKEINFDQLKKISNSET